MDHGQAPKVLRQTPTSLQCSGARVGSEATRDLLQVFPDVRVPFAEDLQGLDHRVCYSLGVILLKLGDRRRRCSTAVAEHGYDAAAVGFLPPKIGEITDHS